MWVRKKAISVSVPEASNSGCSPRVARSGILSGTITKRGSVHSLDESTGVASRAHQFAWLFGVITVGWTHCAAGPRAGGDIETEREQMCPTSVCDSRSLKPL